VIEARNETMTGPDGFTRDYTSAKLTTKGKFVQTYGKFEARMKIPRGQGIWPALWLLAESYDEIGWPDCGEVDIMESVGPVARTLYGTVHGPGYCGANPLQKTVEVDEPLSQDFHIYTLEWEPLRFNWFLDGRCYASVDRAEAGADPWPFNEPFYILMNLAVGGIWPGKPDSTTTFPQRLIVDYVRAWRAKELDWAVVQPVH
jgi:beta-glucanase (GH16 family)